jgi:hypothetical protein
MNRALVDRLVNSVLYEGYLLYPYRASLKNTRRWTFGALYPATSGPACAGTERSETRARMLIVGNPETVVEGELRFLHLIERESRTPANETQAWHEAEERRVRILPQRFDKQSRPPVRQAFEFPGRYWSESGVNRRQEAIRGEISVGCEHAGANVQLFSVTIANHTVSGPPREPDDAVLQALASAHLILHARGGEFVSRIDPPSSYADLCPADPTDGLWPVMVGSPGERDTVLCSPIILYDYPEVAPESPGDFFDATEIDEMLMLRILTLSDEEKRQMAALDPRGRALLRRTDEMAEEHLAKLHGTTRSLRQIEESTDG